jgi:hypothetical protein
MALGLIQPLTEMNTRNISWGVKAAGALGSPYHLHGSLNHRETSGTVHACNRFLFNFTGLFEYGRLLAE